MNINFRLLFMNNMKYYFYLEIGHIGTLAASGSGPYTDDDDAVFLVCHSLESIFLKGLVRHDGFTPWKTDCFQWFHQLVRKYNR